MLPFVPPVSKDQKKLLLAILGAGITAATILVVVIFVLRQLHKSAHRTRAARLIYSDETASDGQAWFDTHIYVEDVELSCDFKMRVECEELASLVSGCCPRIANFGQLDDAHDRFALTSR